MFKGSEMMYKRSQLMKTVAVSLVLLFLIPGLPVIASSPQHLSDLNLNGKNNEKFGPDNSSTGTLKNISSVSYFKNVDNNALFGFKNYTIKGNLRLNSLTQANVQRIVTSAASGLQINSICYGNGVFLIGGENTSISPLLLLFNESSGKLTDISGILPSEFRAVTAISYLNYKFYIVGNPSGNEIPFAILDLKNMTVSSLSSLFPPFVTGPNVDTLSIVGSDLYMGGYYQVNPKSAFLFSYDIINGSIENLTYLLPAYSSMLLTLSSNGKDLFIGGIYGNYSSFALIYNTSSNSLLSVDLPGQIESLSSSTYYDGSFYVGGSSSLGAEFLKIDLNGRVVNLSQSFTNDIQINTINAFRGIIFVGGWAINGSFASIFNPTSMEIMRNIYGSNGWKENGSEMLASCSNGSIIMVGGSVVTQFYNYSGALLGLLNENYSFIDLSNLIPKTYKSITYSTPPLQSFYVYASPNIVFDNENITFVGQGLAKNATYHLYYSNETLTIKTNAEGLFFYSTRIGNLTPGDYLITLAGQNNTYYNYFAVPYSYGNMIYGSKIPKTGTIGYSNLKYGAVVRDGEYLEFYRQTYGQIPVTSINYLVQWNQILFQNLTSKGWTVAPVNQLGYASQFSINPMTFQYSFWNDYGIVEVSNSGQFTSFPTSNSYIYVNGSEMIVWIPYSIVNETYFPWAFATDYVQESPVYNPNYRIEAGQSFVSWYYGNETPSMLSKNMNEVKFYENGLPSGTVWEISIINESSEIPEYYQNYTSNTNEIIIALPNGNYDYIVSSSLSQYVTQNATGSFSLNSSNVSYEVNFFLSPISIGRQYLNIPAYSNEILNLTPNTGPESLSFGVMNSTLNIILLNGNSIIYNRTIIGQPTQWTVMQTSNTYGYVNFNGTGETLKMIVKNLGNKTGLLTYDLWDYYISNFTASLITLPPQFAENFGPFNLPFNMNNNTGLSFVLKAPYYKFPVPLAIWIGEGYNDPVTGKFWWAQIGFNNWLGGMNDVSYAGWGIFSNIFGSPGGTDGTIPLIPNETYNFTMELIDKTTWAFLVNGVPINEPGLSAFFNTTSSYSNMGFDLGFEVLTQVRAGTPNSSSFLPNPMEVLKSMMMRINGNWIMVPNFSHDVVGENWWNGNSTVSMGVNLWSVQGHIQNKSIPPGEIVFSNLNIPFFNIPSYQNLVTYPIYGNFSYPYQNISSYGNFINVKYENNGTIYVKPNFRDVLVSLLEFVNDSNILKNFTNYIISNPTYINNPYNSNFEAIVAALGNNTSQGYGGKFQEIVLTHLKEYTINFIESGLHNGISWYVNLSNGQAFSSTINNITIHEPNGTYSYTISTSNKNYLSHPSSGSFTVNGSNLNISVSFRLVTYTVIFTESGLPSGYWYVNITGQPSSGPISSSQTSYSVSLPNGSYSYTISTGNNEYKPSYTGSFIVNGASVSQSISFSKVTYTVTFTESGLPSGASWSITLNGTTKSSTTNTITFSVPNGTYSYTIGSISGYTALPSSGTIMVNGANVNVAITFTLVTYRVTFTENGLPSGTMWYVNLSNGQSYSGTGTTITFQEPNGSYSYTIATVNKIYAPNPSSGTIMVNGANVNVAITFNLVTYKITFTESGLSSGTSWSVTLNNITKTSTNGTIIFNEPNGTYSYIISGISGYRANTYSGTINVNGNPVSVSINWTVITYPITITENGIPNGTSWSATLTGTTFNGQYINVTLSSTTNTITFYEPNGTYSYTIHLPSGYQLSLIHI